MIVKLYCDFCQQTYFLKTPYWIGNPDERLTALCCRYCLKEYKVSNPLYFQEIVDEPETQSREVNYT